MFHCGELRHGVAELKVDTVEERPLGRIRSNEELSNLCGVGIGCEILVDRKRRVEAHFPPVGNAVGPFARTLKGTIGNEAAGKIRLLAPNEGVVRMQLERPLTDFGNFGVVDLNLIDRVCRDCRGNEHD